MTKKMNARFTSRCTECGSQIQPGDVILFDTQARKSRHESCPEVKQNPKPKIAKGTWLNSPVIAQPQVSRLTEQAAQEILRNLGSEYMRPLPTGEPMLGIGYEVEIDGKQLQIGTCGDWVGIATEGFGLYTDPSADPTEHVISLIDGKVLETAPWRKSHGIDYWTRQLGAPMKCEAQGKNSVKIGDVKHTKSGWFLVISVDKPYYMSDEDAEEMDMFSRGGGWGTPYEMREITEPVAEREKRKAKEAADRNQADQAIAAIQALRAEVTTLFPLGIRRMRTDENEKIRQLIQSGKAEIVATNISVPTDRVVLKLIDAAVTDGLRLPPMPGNEQGFLGWTKIYRVADRLVVEYVDTSYDGYGWMLQGISVLPEDTALLADQENRKKITGYRFDSELFQILADLDKEGKLSEYGRYAYFGGTPCQVHGPNTQGAYSHENNQTAQELRRDLQQRFAKLKDQCAAIALRILEREDSVVELREADAH